MAVLEQHEDRRASRRRPFAEIPHVIMVKVSSEVVDVIDASANGLLVEGGFPVRPGMTSYVDLIEADGNNVRVNGSIVRCHIASLGPNKPRYRFAIVFDRAVPMIEQGVDATEMSAASEQRFGFPIEDAETEFAQALALNNW
jgi:hypothetical protein